MVVAAAMAQGVVVIARREVALMSGTVCLMQ